MHSFTNSELTRIRIRTVLSLAFLVAGFVTAQASAEIRAFWVDAWHPGFKSKAEVSQLMANVRSANCNTVFVQIRRRGDAFYFDSPYEPKSADRKFTSNGIDSLAELIREGHDTSQGHKVNVHAWLVVYPVSSVKKTNDPKHVLNQHPDWSDQSVQGHKQTGSYQALDPGHPEAQRHIYNVTMDILSRYDIDGLHLDYIHYADRNWGYNPVSVERFNKQFERIGIPRPDDSDWVEFRRQQVTALVRKIYLSSLAAKPHVVVSAGTISQLPGVSSFKDWEKTSAYYRLMQDWRGWMEEGILDVNVLMAYYRQASPGYAKNFADWCRFAKDHSYGRAVVIGMAPYLNSPSNTVRQIQIAREKTPEGHGANGVAFFSYHQLAVNKKLSRKQILDSMITPVFASPAGVPDMPWKTQADKGALKGVVHDGKTDSTLDGARIRIFGGVNKETISDATGFYGMVKLPPGDYQSVATYRSRQSVTNQLSIRAGQVTTVDFTVNE